MKKLLTVLFAAVLVFSLCSCGASAPKTDSVSSIIPNMLENSSLTTVDGTLTKAYASAVVNNGSTLELYSGNENDFFIEVQQNGVWYSLKEPEDLANTAEALIFDPAANAASISSGSHATARLPPDITGSSRRFSQTPRT
ncbi:MAG: hypothetical protein J5569_02960 [Oscillospiraceae bacterium]|nr:hypothetical protein [Oscillospiraceae bacterium]